MHGRVFFRLFAMLVAVVFPIAFIAAPAHAAPKPKVTVKASAKSVAAGGSVKLTGKVTKKSKGATVTLQRKDGSAWTNIAKSKVKAKGKYSFTTRPPAGKYAYRVRVAKTKKIKAATSKVAKVTGLMTQSTNYSSSGQTFRVLAQTPAPSGAPVVLQELSNGSWQQIASGTVNASGLANLSTDATTNLVRIHVPAGAASTGGYAPWTSPSIKLTVASAEVNKILSDINAVRANAGKAPLILHDGLSEVAQNWTQYLFDNCVFKHNPNFAKQTPGNWRRAGENIAAGQSVETVVDAWYKSPGHRENMLGDYTHIGIGIVIKTNMSCPAGKRYPTHFTTNFAKY